MIYTITVTTTFDSEDKADAFVDAIAALDEENMFPEGAAVQRDIKPSPLGNPYEHSHDWSRGDVKMVCMDCGQKRQWIAGNWHTVQNWAV